MHDTTHQQQRLRAGLRLRHHADQLSAPVRQTLGALRRLRKAGLATVSERESLCSAGEALAEAMDALDWLADVLAEEAGR